MKIVYKEKKTDNSDNYQTLCIDELIRLGTFFGWHISDYETIEIIHTHSNSEAFAKCGIIQTALMEYAYFGADCSTNMALYLELGDTASWKEVYDILSSIDHIELD